MMAAVRRARPAATTKAIQAALPSDQSSAVMDFLTPCQRISTPLRHLKFLTLRSKCPNMLKADHT